MNTGGPNRDGTDMSLSGVYIAIVTQNKDSEKSLARVKVRLPWLPSGDSMQTYWARVAAPMIGDEYGTYTLPEVNDTVLVMFVAGNLQWPVVVGSLWNKTDKPPQDNKDEKNDFRLIKSRAGHRLIFDDSDKTKVVLTDYKNEQYVGVGAFDKGGSGPNATKLEAPTAINGSPKEGVSFVSANGGINLFAPDGKLTLDGMHVELTAADAAEVKSAQDMQLKGNLGTVAASQSAKFGGSKVKVN